MRDDGHAHAHVAAQIVDVVDAAVHNRIGRAAVRLRIDNTRQVGSAFGGEEASHLDGQLADRCQSFQIRRKLTQGREGVAVILVVEIGEVQPGTVFDADGFKAVFRFQPRYQLGEHRQLLALTIELFALSAGEVVDAFDADARRVRPMIQRGKKVALVHAELRTGCQPQKNGIDSAALLRCFVDEADMQGGFAGEPRHAAVHRPLDILARLVYAGKEDGVGRDALLHADFQFAGAANLKRADETAHGGDEKRVCLNRIAERDARREHLPHGTHALFQRGFVKDEARRAETPGNGGKLLIIHGGSPFWRLSRRRTAQAARRGRFCRFCSAAWRPPA